MSNNNVNFNINGLTVGNTTISSNGNITSTANISVGSLLVNGIPVTSGGGSGGGLSYVSSSFSASGGYSYMVDTSSSAVVATLPSAPTNGTVVKFTDMNNSFGLNSFTVNPNGQTIAGRTGNLVINNSDASFSLIYDGTKWNPRRDQTRKTISYLNNVQSTTSSLGGGNGTNLSPHQIAFGNGVFVSVVNWSSVALVSTDGINWSSYGLPVGDWWQMVRYANGKFIAGGSGNAAAISSDGKNWISVSVPIASGMSSFMYSAFGNNTWVLTGVGGGGPVAYSSITVSTDGGNTWATHAMPSSQSWIGIAYGNGVFVTAAYGGSVCAVSPDGVTWTQYNLPSTQNWSDVSFGNGLFVAVGGGVYAVSPDGINWTQYTVPNSMQFNNLNYGGGVFCALGGIDFVGGTQTTAFATSVDGINWVERQFPSSYQWIDTVYGNGVFVSVAWVGSASTGIMFQTIII